MANTETETNNPTLDYLGDSVYAEIENGILVLTTRNGLPNDPSNKIYLEPEVFKALLRYYDRQY